jgi:hypothetical protein
MGGRNRVRTSKGEVRNKNRLGSELLSPDLSRSIIAAEGLNGRVRDGIACLTFAMATKPILIPCI